MKVRCKSVSGMDVPVDQRLPGESDQTRYLPLEVGREYPVFALLFFERRVEVLTCASDVGPEWTPLALFDVVDPMISDEMGLLDVRGSTDFIWLRERSALAMIGYPELISSSAHFVGILERDDKELSGFFQRYRSGPES